MSRLSDAQIDELKARVDLAALAEKFGAVLRKSGRQMIGACPVCGGGKKATRFAIKADGQSWVCAVCSDGGDAVALVQKVRGCDFRAAVDFLGGPAELDAEEEQKLEDRRAAEARKREAAAAKFRADAIARGWRLWHGAQAFDLGPVRAYLAARGCDLPATAEIRAGRNAPYFHGEFLDGVGRSQPRLLARLPAMISAVRDNAGEFIAAHVTYLDVAGAGKVRLQDPDFQEGDDEKNRFLKAKKFQGAMAGGHIVLRQPASLERLFMGEGIETVLSVATALRATRRLRPGDGFWSSGDLGNLGGRAVETVKHPTLKTAAGRAQSVPGPVPDLSAPGIAIPESVRELVLLGDGDSEAFLTAMTMERARARFARPGLAIRVAMAPAGLDFNDVLMGRPEAEGRRMETEKAA
jgi:hypothetical protein